MGWWGSASELLQAVSFPLGRPSEEALFLTSADPEHERRKSLLYVAAYGDAEPDVDTFWEILFRKGIIVRFELVPAGETPAFFGPLWTQKTVTVRGRQARLFEASRQGSTTDAFRSIRWEVAAASPMGAQVQFAVTVHPDHYSERAHIDLIDAMRSR